MSTRRLSLALRPARFLSHFGSWVAAIALLVAGTASAQGLTDSLSDINLPSQQTAAADDAWSIYSNPAGLAYVDSLQLMAGFGSRWVHGSLVNQFDDQIINQGQAVLALQPLEGLTFASATGLIVPVIPGRQNGQPPSQWRSSFAMASRLGRAVSVGATAHLLRASTSGAPFRWQGSIGAQLRPASFVSLGFAVENLNADLLGLERTNYRAGVSVRPIGDLLTIGLDTRFRAGALDVFAPDFDYISKGMLEPALTARLDFGGAAIVAGARVGNFRPLDGNPFAPTIEGSLLVEINTAHLGAALMGSTSTSLDGGGPLLRTGGGGVYARVSAERYPSVLSLGGRWPTFSLVGPAVPESDVDGLVDAFFETPTPPEVVLAELDRAARDPAVEGVVIRLRSFALGWGRATEFRSLLKHLRENGKFVAVHMDGADDVMLYVASAADRIYLSPAAQLDVNGVHMNLTYLADALARVGIKAEAIAAGAYKSAPRTFTHDGPSKEEIEVQNAILDEIFGTLVEGVATGRGLTEEEVRDVLTYGGLSAQEAKERRLIDGIAYWNNLANVLSDDEDITGKPRFDRSYLDRNERVTTWESVPTIAIVPVVGTIQQGRSEGGLFDLFSGSGAGADDIVDALEAAHEDDDVKAVVIRIDSPGGDALASDLIWNAVMRLREDKHVVISMGDLAASGGYYIAAAGEHIFAEPQTLTGSIGVFSLFFQGEQLANDLGVRTYEIGRGGPQQPSVLTAPSPQSRAVMERQVAQIYERFLDAIVQGRDIERDALKKVAGGRVWTGRQALERNLVDELGGLDDALRHARSLADIPEDGRSNIAILVGDDEVLPRLSTAVQAVLRQDPDVLRARRAVRAVLGSDAATLELAAEGRPLMMNPALIEVR